MSPATPLLRTVADAVGRLADAGVESPRVDAELLAAHVMGVTRSRLLLAAGPTAQQAHRLADLVARRAAREPLQHLLGTAVLGPVEVAVGPGVFVPRPETEVLLAWALEALRALDGTGSDRMGAPVVADLCTGSAALALALAASRPDAVVHAVETDPGALVWARRNVAGTSVVLHDADVTAPGILDGLRGGLDLVVANPPYVPGAAVVGPEVHHDPAVAVFGGPDGLAVIRPLAALAARLLRPGGRVGVEHDETHAPAVAAVLGGAGFTDVVTRTDLAGRPRVTTGQCP